MKNNVIDEYKMKSFIWTKQTNETLLFLYFIFGLLPKDILSIIYYLIGMSVSEREGNDQPQKPR